MPWVLTPRGVEQSFRMEGIGLTGTDPAFFDAVDFSTAARGPAAGGLAGGLCDFRLVAVSNLGFVGAQKGTNYQIKPPGHDAIAR